MGLPPYSGPFKVGILDLEVPVRQPRSFCDNVVAPGELNKPARKARKWAKKQNQDAKDRRREGRSECATTETSTPSTSLNQTNDEHVEDESEAWSPWSSGSKTSTLHLETVLFSLYYPTQPMSDAEEKRYPRAAWIGRPVHAGVRALAQYIGQYGAFAIPASPAIIKLVKARLPARVGPPLADPAVLHQQAHPDREDTDRAKAGNFGKHPPQFPVVIFSHGLAGNRLSYSQYCGELASQGIIVAAIEHRDGSGVSSIVRGEEAPNHPEQTAGHFPKIIGRKSSGRMKASVPYFTFEQIGLNSFSEKPNEQEVDLRRDQIEMRHAEIEETFYVLNEINLGRGHEIVQRSTRKLGTKLAGHAASAENDRIPKDSLLKAKQPLADWKGTLDLDFPTLCGHSFGGATVIEMMRKANPYPIAVVLDPYVDPVRDPAKEEDEVKGRLSKPLYVLNSESFTVWGEHFEKLKRICLDARKTSGRGWLLTLTGSKHTDFSDYPFLLPRIFRSTVGPRHTIEVFSKATYMQMGLSRQRAREQEDKPGYKVDRQGSLRSGSNNGSSLTRIITNQDQTGVLVSSPTAKSRIGPGDQGVVQSPAAVSIQDPMKHEGADAHTSANDSAATPAIERSPPQQTRSSTSQNNDNVSCQQLRDESKSDEAATGQEARDLLRERQRTASLGAVSVTDSFAEHLRTSQEGHVKDFITNVKYLKMIDADQDVQQVHEELEEISERLAHKKTRPRSLMSIFLYYNGFRPGLERPGKVLIHQLDSSHPPK